jgi:uncharacterized membrane protein YeiB
MKVSSCSTKKLLVKRIPALDILRGFALIGILGANIPGLARVVLPAAGSTNEVLFRIAQYGFEQRFFPMFSFLFGVGFFIFMRTARAHILYPPRTGAHWIWGRASTAATRGSAAHLRHLWAMLSAVYACFGAHLVRC